MSSNPDAVDRVRLYLDGYESMPHLPEEDIHAVACAATGYEDAPLKVSDLRAILRRLDAAEQLLDATPATAPKLTPAERKLATLDRKIETTRGRLGLARDRRRAKGSRIQSMAEVKIDGQLSTLRRERYTLAQEIANQ